MRTIALILFALFIAGCGGKWVGIDAGKAVTTANIQDAEYAYVLSGVSGCPVTTWLHTSVPSDVKKPNPDEGMVLSTGWTCGVKYQLNVAKPGKYTLIHFIEDNGRQRFVMTDKARKLNDELKDTNSAVGSFYADGGVITYIGTLRQKTNYSEARYSYTVDNELEEAKEFIRKNYPGIDPESIIFRPAQRGVTNY